METWENRVLSANRRVVRRLLLAVTAMFAFGFALAPLYDVLCRITGLNGKTGGRVVVARPVAVDETRTVTVEFVASLNAAAPWEFAPKVTRMAVHPGQYYQTQFLARNLTGQPLTGQAVPSVAPGPAARHDPGRRAPGWRAVPRPAPGRRRPGRPGRPAAGRAPRGR